MNYKSNQEKRQASARVARDIGKKLEAFVKPLLVELDEQIDKRLVRTFLATLQAIVQFRDRAQGLLLSELGAYITSPKCAPAGTKRLSNLLRSKKWSYHLIERFLWRQADQRLGELEEAGEDALFVWDESVIEKSEGSSTESVNCNQ